MTEIKNRMKIPITLSCGRTIPPQKSIVVEESIESLTRRKDVKNLLDRGWIELPQEERSEDVIKRLQSQVNSLKLRNKELLRDIRLLHAKQESNCTEIAEILAADKNARSKLKNISSLVKKWNSFLEAYTIEEDEEEDYGEWEV